MADRIDLHVHSCYSRFDGMMSPRAIVNLAEELGYQAVAVTDHYTYDGALRGTLATQRLATDRDLTAYTGLEYHVTEGDDTGHVLVYFDHVDQVPERGLTLDELLDHTREHGLTVIHPHPYGFAGIQSLELMRAADHVELNGSYGTGEVNERLLRTAREHGFEGKLVANSDAHARGQMGAAYTEVTQLEDHLTDTLAHLDHAAIGQPKRSWGRAAKIARAIAQPVGLVMNGVQRLVTRKALAAVDAAYDELIAGTSNPSTASSTQG